MRIDQVLYMVRLELDAARVARETINRNLSPRNDDLGYLVHCCLADLFGTGSVQPFRVLSERSRWLVVLGYTKTRSEELRQHAADFADPGHYAACDWDGLAVKPLPTEWQTGRRLLFNVRVCPVVRLSSDVEVHGKNGETRGYRAGSEIDAWEHFRFFAAKNQTDISRDDAYKNWLSERLGNAASISAANIRSFRRLRLTRRDHGRPRKAGILERPDVILQGDITVGDATAFETLLGSGVGRHRAFGFGMLLLRPPEG
jgi:CRISPR system Cascade subunit CasE